MTVNAPTTPPASGDDVALVAHLRAAAAGVPEPALDLETTLRRTKRHVRRRRAGITAAVTACAVATVVALVPTGAPPGSHRPLAVAAGADAVIVHPAEPIDPTAGVTEPSTVTVHRLSGTSALVETTLPTGVDGEQFVIVVLRLVNADPGERTAETMVVRADDAKVRAIVDDHSTIALSFTDDPTVRATTDGRELVTDAGTPDWVSGSTDGSTPTMSCFPLTDIGWTAPDGSPLCVSAALVDAPAGTLDQAATPAD